MVDIMKMAVARFADSLVLVPHDNGVNETHRCVWKVSCPRHPVLHCAVRGGRGFVSELIVSRQTALRSCILAFVQRCRCVCTCRYIHACAHS